MNKTKKSEEGGNQGDEGEKMQIEDEKMDQQQIHGMENEGSKEETSNKGGREPSEQEDQVERVSSCTHELDLNNPPTEYSMIPYANIQQPKP